MNLFPYQRMHVVESLRWCITVDHTNFHKMVLAPEAG